MHTVGPQTQTRWVCGQRAVKLLESYVQKLPAYILIVFATLLVDGNLDSPNLKVNQIRMRMIYKVYDMFHPYFNVNDAHVRPSSPPQQPFIGFFPMFQTNNSQTSQSKSKSPKVPA